MVIIIKYWISTSQTCLVGLCMNYASVCSFGVSCLRACVIKPLSVYRHFLDKNLIFIISSLIVLIDKQMYSFSCMKVLLISAHKLPQCGCLIMPHLVFITCKGCIVPYYHASTIFYFHNQSLG